MSRGQLLTKSDLARRLDDLDARFSDGDLPRWLEKVLRAGARTAYQREAESRKSARRKVQTEKDAGRLEVPDHCSLCGSPLPLQAHHRDHNQALEIRWLCSNCHVLADRAVASGLREYTLIPAGVDFNIFLFLAGLEVERVSLAGEAV